MNEIQISKHERLDKHLSTENLNKAIRAVREDGYIVLHDIIETGHIAILRDRMLADVEKILSLDAVPYQFRKGHIQQDPPPFKPFLFRDVLVNPFVIDITQVLLGDGVKNAFYSGNCCLPGSQHQPIHFDMGPLWPNWPNYHPVHAIVVNVPVVDMSPENGSTELWPQTHLNTARSETAGDIKIPDNVIKVQREQSQPFQPKIPVGSILIRDIRLWHRGMPNKKDLPRPMIAMIHYPRWYQTGKPIQFANGSEELLKDERLTTIAEFVDEPIDYISHHRTYDYSS
ncbi:MAG: phytanoyl-CoA dioxygenase family protein [Candidatus Latescibacterota bacterium]|nr:phytanoyl-CoA dioxygenase family protein [Candidatus Latescibacterota bacterium]